MNCGLYWLINGTITKTSYNNPPPMQVIKTSVNAHKKACASQSSHSAMAGHHPVGITDILLGREVKCCEKTPTGR